MSLKLIWNHEISYFPELKRTFGALNQNLCLIGVKTNGEMSAHHLIQKDVTFLTLIMRNLRRIWMDWNVSYIRIQLTTLLIFNTENHFETGFSIKLLFSIKPYHIISWNFDKYSIESKKNENVKSFLFQKISIKLESFVNFQLHPNTN